MRRMRRGGAPARGPAARILPLPGGPIKRQPPPPAHRRPSAGGGGPAVLAWPPEGASARPGPAAGAEALGRALPATPLARRPAGLRHAALSLWLASGAPPAEIAARAGHSIHLLL